MGARGGSPRGAGVRRRHRSIADAWVSARGDEMWRRGWSSCEHLKDGEVIMRFDFCTRAAEISDLSNTAKPSAVLYARWRAKSAYTREHRLLLYLFCTAIEAQAAFLQKPVCFPLHRTNQSSRQRKRVHASSPSRLHSDATDNKNAASKIVHPHHTRNNYAKGPSQNFLKYLPGPSKRPIRHFHSF